MKLRRKRWDYWAIASERELIMVLVADVGYLGGALISHLDLETGERVEAVAPRPFALGCRLPDSFGAAPIRFAGPGLTLEMSTAPSGETRIAGAGRTLLGKQIALEVAIRPPAGYQPLDVTVPFPGSRASHFTSKRPGLPASGSVTVGGATRALAAPAFATLDFGHGTFPYRTAWNWAAASGVRDGRTIAINLGGRWTDGSGVTENGLWIDGRLARIGDDVRFERAGDGWRLRSPGVALDFAPLRRRNVGFDLGAVCARLDWGVGLFSGSIAAGDARCDASGLLGWCEAFDARW